MDSRLAELTAWVSEKLNINSAQLKMVSGDASFRRYYRVRFGDDSWIAMDAPPEQEDSHSFVAVAEHWRRNSINVPQIRALDLLQGFLLLSDFGDRVLLSELQAEQNQQLSIAAPYYDEAIATLLRIQELETNPDYILPNYNRALLVREMELFRHWLLEKKLGLTLSGQEHNLLNSSFNTLLENALSQPQVPVHRDYHSRNLMVLDENSLGVLDFQDAVLGPVSYDLVSLLRDCYIVWPDNQVEAWCQQYHQKAKAAGLITCDYAQFKTWFDLMGMQRHLKAAGIFARLSLRDGKHAYLEDVPRTVAYIVRVGRQYESTQALSRWLEKKLVPLLVKFGSAT